MSHTHDGWDTRTIPARTGDYIGALGRGAHGVRVGVLTEGFGDPDMDEKVRGAIDAMRSIGAEITEISVPMHYDGPHIWTGVILEGAAEMMIKSDRVGDNVPTYYPVSMQEAFARGLATRINDVPETVKMVLLLGEYLHRNYYNRYRSKAQNLRVLRRDAYSHALEEVDVIAMPTIPFTATEIPAADTPREVVIDRALNMQANTCPFDVSAHAAFTIPCGRKDSLPIGLMLVGRHYDEETLLRLAAAFEAMHDWRRH